jgi:hypothetical protein
LGVGTPAAIAEFSFSDLTDPANLRSALDVNGVAIVRGLLQASEIGRLREIVRDHLTAQGHSFGLGRTQPNAVATVSALEFLYGDARIARLFSGLCGDGNTVFTGHSDIHLNMLSGWHKDSGEAYGGYFRGDYFSAEDCRVYKIAFYLQDHLDHGGLTARPGSHREPSVETGPAVHLATRAGDAIVFDVRVSHIGQIPDVFEKSLMAGNLLLNRGDRKRADRAFVVALKNFYWRVIGRKDKMSIFFTFGANNSFTWQFAANNMDRQNVQAKIQDTEISLSLAEQLRHHNVIAFTRDLAK